MSERKAIPHLLDEPPISVYPSLAKALGNVNKAIILQQVHFLLNAARLSNNKYVEIDGKWWVYNSYKQWKDSHFTWLAEVTIKGLFGMLEHDGLIISRQGVKDAFDRKKWYTIDYDRYLTYISSIGQKVSDVLEIKSIPSEIQKVSSDNRKSETPNSESKNNTRAKAQSTPKPVRFPEDTYKYTAKHIDAYQTLHDTNISFLIKAWYANPMYTTLKDIPLFDAKQCIATHKELERLGVCPPDYATLIKQTRESKALAWKLTKGGITIADVQSEILAFKAVKPVMVSGETYGERAVKQGRAMFFGGNERGGNDGSE